MTLWTGLGLSLSTATYLRWVLLFLGVASFHDVTLSALSRAPLGKLQAYKRRMGWTFPWASSLGNDFNADFHVWFTEEQQREGRIDYNYRREPAWKGGGEGSVGFAAMSGTDAATYRAQGDIVVCVGIPSGHALLPFQLIRLAD
jgi:hypothetical protein